MCIRDRLIEALGIKDPLYVDIGVCHPVVRNNTYLLYEKGYTNGILIEPNGNMCELAQIYRPKNKIVEAGASGDEGGILRYYMNHQSSLKGYNTFNQEVAEREGFADNYKDVPVMNINRILEEKMCIRDRYRKYEILFLPYKAAMWDSMESIYLAAVQNSKCRVSVMPVPYYLLEDGKKTAVYEGNRFPEGLPIVDAYQYKLKEERPDVIFIHNPYDGYNRVTRVEEQFYSSELIKYTSHLCYVPYDVVNENSFKMCIRDR